MHGCASSSSRAKRPRSRQARKRGRPTGAAGSVARGRATRAATGSTDVGRRGGAPGRPKFGCASQDLGAGRSPRYPGLRLSWTRPRPWPAGATHRTIPMSTGPSPRPRSTPALPNGRSRCPRGPWLTRSTTSWALLAHGSSARIFVSGELTCPSVAFAGYEPAPVDAGTPAWRVAVACGHVRCRVRRWDTRVGSDHIGRGDGPLLLELPECVAMEPVGRSHGATGTSPERSELTLPTV